MTSRPHNPILSLTGGEHEVDDAFDRVWVEPEHQVEQLQIGVGSAQVGQKAALTRLLRLGPDDDGHEKQQLALILWTWWRGGDDY